jgi:zinc transporter, ZIP family
MPATGPATGIRRVTLEDVPGRRGRFTVNADPPSRAGMLSFGMLAAVLALAAFVAATGAVWPALRLWLADLNTLQLGILASFVAGMFTAVGAILD